jgi:hypothetical protein
MAGRSPPSSSFSCGVARHQASALMAVGPVRRASELKLPTDQSRSKCPL